MLLLGIATIIVGYINVTQIAYRGSYFHPFNYYLGIIGITVGVACICLAIYFLFKRKSKMTMI